MGCSFSWNPKSTNHEIYRLFGKGAISVLDYIGISCPLSLVVDWSSKLGSLSGFARSFPSLFWTKLGSHAPWVWVDWSSKLGSLSGFVRNIAFLFHMTSHDSFLKDLLSFFLHLSTNKISSLVAYPKQSQDF